LDARRARIEEAFDVGFDERDPVHHPPHSFRKR
jgi:hypothetical protein